jgi:Fatty acid desaturase
MARFSTARQWLLSSGFLSVLIAPALLIAGIELDRPLLAFGVVMLLYPLARPVFGEIGDAAVEWTEPVSVALHRLPVLVALIGIGLMTWVPWRLFGGAAESTGYLVALGLSLWIVLLLATCTAHELIHRSSPWEARLGRWLAAAGGYPLLALEHLNHHLRPGDVSRAEWPDERESVFGFARRRLTLVVRSAAEVALGRAGSPRARNALFETCLVTALAACAFALCLGMPGLVLYAGVAVGVTLGFQAITYLQHWGLGSSTRRVGAVHAIAWEDSCRFQAWVTLNVGCHQAHHTNSRLPFYRLAPEPGSPRQPAGYVILLLLSLMPPLWFHLMRPALDAWRHDPWRAMPTGRRLTCFHIMSREAG